MQGMHALLHTTKFGHLRAVFFALTIHVELFSIREPSTQYRPFEKWFEISFSLIAKIKHALHSGKDRCLVYTVGQGEPTRRVRHGLFLSSIALGGFEISRF